MPRVRRSEEDQRLVDSHGPTFLEVLARGLKVIGAFNAERRQVTLSQLAGIVGLPRASVRRVLHTLETLGYVETDGRLFKLTPRVLTLASAYLSSNNIATTLQPIVSRISSRVNESCSAAVLDKDEVVFVARANPARIVSIGLEVGYRLPAYCTSVGRVLLGDLDPAALQAFIDRIEPVALTGHTITDKDILKAAIITDRKQGYSIVDQEAELGLRSIAVPARRYDGRLACALHIGVHVERVSIGRMHDEFLPLLTEAAEELRSMLI